MVELVFDMIYPEQTQAHVEMMTSEVNDQSFASAVYSVRTLSSFGTVSGEDESEWDFTSEAGIAKYLSQVKQTTVNDFRMRSNFFLCCLDGLRHAYVPCEEQAHCQYCYYQWSNCFDEKQQQAFFCMK